MRLFKTMRPAHAPSTGLAQMIQKTPSFLPILSLGFFTIVMGGCATLESSDRISSNGQSIAYVFITQATR